ncbi:MAG: hypothetical protein Q4E37_02440 [Tissierellia bacterium]|nr:hypothetical protein [Tissierellia bacterium]
MIKYILGAKGAGKTKWLIDHANDDLNSGNGNIVFVEVDDDHIFSLDHNVRLVNATEFNLENVDTFYGFFCGLMAMDYDLEKIYVDGIYKVLDLTLDDLEYLHNKLEKLDTQDKEIYINVDYLTEDLPDQLKQYGEEVVEG